MSEIRNLLKINKETIALAKSLNYDNIEIAKDGQKGNKNTLYVSERINPNTGLATGKYDIYEGGEFSLFNQRGNNFTDLYNTETSNFNKAKSCERPCCAQPTVPKIR